MKTTYDLVQALSDSFDDSLSKSTDNRITAPILVIYSGKNSTQYDNNIMNAFRQVWLTARAERICRAVRRKQTLSPVIGESNDIFQYVDAMYHCDEVIFDNFSKLTTVIIYDSRDYSSHEEMIRDYESDVEYFSHEFRQYNTTVVRIIVIENSRGRLEFKESIRKYLSQQSDNKNCKGTFLLSTSLFDGRQKAYDQIYDLIGKIIAVGCTDSALDHNLDVFGSFDDGTIRTVSYTKMERPNTEICAIIIGQYIKWLNNYNLTKSIPSEKTIKERLGLTDNGYTITESIYNRIKNNFPSIDALEHLPMNRTGKGVEKIANMQFSEFDELTMNGFEMFYQHYYMTVINDGVSNEHMRNAVKKLIHENFSQPEIMQFTTEIIEKIATWLDNSTRRIQPGQIVAKHIENYNMVNLERTLAEIIIDEIKNQRDLARQQAGIVDKVNEDFVQNVIVSDDNVGGYYESKVEEYLKEYGKVFVTEVMDEALDKQGVLARMYHYAIKMIESRGEFKLAFEDELKVRTNDENGIYRYIHENIMANTNRNIFFNARVMPDPLFRVVLMNQKKNNGMNTELYVEMSQNLFKTDSDYFIDNGNSNGIVALQVYSLSSVAIL